MTPTAHETASAGDLFVPTAARPDTGPVTPVPVAPDPPPSPARSRSTAPAWVVCAVLGVLAVVRVALAAARLPARPGEAELVDGAYAVLRLPGVPAPGGGGPTEIVARAQIAGYAQLTGAFERWPDVLDGARELSVVTFCLLLVAVMVVGRRRGALPIAVGLALFVVIDPAVDTFAAVGPGQLGVAWLAVAGALGLSRSRVSRGVAAPAAVLGVVTAPLLIVPVVVVVVLVVLAALTSAGAEGARTARVALLGTAVVATALGGVLALTRPAPVPPAGAVPDTLRALLVVGVLVAASALVRAAVAGPTGVRRGLVAAAVAGWVALAVVSTVTARPDQRAESPHRDLAAWIVAVTAPPTTLRAPPGVWSDLIRDGVPADRLGPDGTLVIGVGPGQDGLARFGAGPAQLSVRPAGPDTPITTILERESRITAGLQLAGNPRLAAPDAVRETLSAGGVDSRALVILGGLAGRGPIAVTDLPVVAGEEPALPRHRVVITGLSPADLDWLRAQLPPFAPMIAPIPDNRAPGELTLSWTVPAPPSVLNR